SRENGKTPGRNREAYAWHGQWGFRRLFLNGFAMNRPQFRILTNTRFADENGCNKTKTGAMAWRNRQRIFPSFSSQR
ncbi:hypothetical protein, partial [uncultured Bacteroides sp.]|uniref:hypothetical protein n=1 Tax=uncultured Bacteroides sp. TaxID=162156 RepID=UPI0025949F18